MNIFEMLGLMGEALSVYSGKRNKWLEEGLLDLFDCRGAEMDREFLVAMRKTIDEAIEEIDSENSGYAEDKNQKRS